MKFVELIKAETSHNETLNLDSVKATFRGIKKNEITGEGLMYDTDRLGTKFYAIGKCPDVGSVFNGSIMQLETTDYPIGERTVNKITVVAIGEESPTNVANGQLERHQACVVLNGKPTVDFNKLMKTPKVGEPA